MTKDNVVLICNGEIYNHQQLSEHFNFKMSSLSDCEIILHLYLLLGFEDTIKRLEGEFSIALYDQNKDILYIGRDRFGVRGLMYGQDHILDRQDHRYDQDQEEYVFASEAIALSGLTPTIRHFPAGNWWSSESKRMTSYFSLLPISIKPKYSYTDAAKIIYQLLEDAVRSRVVMSDRPNCTLLSGGIDSTIISYLVSKFSLERKISNRPIDAFTIGLENSDTLLGQGDLYYADIAAKEFKLNHIKRYVTEADIISSVNSVVKAIGSFDITSVRASIFNYEICQTIKNRSELSDLNRNAVVFSGEFSDEIFNSYKGAMRAPDPIAFYNANLQMVNECQFFDFIRGDRCISNASLEGRLPFTDTKLVVFVMSLPPEFKMFKTHGGEKMILRDAFKGKISDVLLYRPKEAFSDATGVKSRPPYMILQEHAEKLYTDDEFKMKSSQYTHLTPPNKEALWYRELFERHYKGHDNIVPKFWKHAFADHSSEDPSARTI